MPPTDTGRLFHAIVLMGVSLTGGAIASCGGATSQDEGSHKDAAADAPYDGIVAADGHYADIVAPDGYSQIGIYQPDSPSDVNHPDSDAATPLDAPADDGCYPCIAPAGDA
jgi:hypothetical protein